MLLRPKVLGSVISRERDEQQMAMKVAYHRREVVEAKVKGLFPNQAPAEILRLLDKTPRPPVGGPERLQLAILKLSKGDMARLRRYVDALGRGDNDLLRSAEFPTASRIGFLNCTRLPAFLQERIFNRDFRQYMAWLKKDEAL